MPYTADPYDDTKPTGATLALYLDEEIRAAKGVLKDHRTRVAALEDTEASTTVAGIVRLATNPELLAGDDALHPITSAQLAMMLAADVSGAQYKVVLGKTLSLRMGTLNVRTSIADTPVVFTEPFTGAFGGVVFTRKATASGQEGTALLYNNESVNGFTMTHSAIGVTWQMCWLAWGTEL